MAINSKLTASQVNHIEEKTDIKSVNEFLKKHRGSIKNIKQEEYYNQPSYFSMPGSISGEFFAERSVRLVAELEIDVESFSNIVKRMEMIDTMMHDPETADLLRQAEFITRLKQGRIL